jgi:uncharacterized protein (AIM24 family)
MKTTIGSSIEVRLEPGKALNIARSRTVSCSESIKRKSLVFPQCDAAIARLLNGLLFVRQIFASETPGTVTLSCAHGKRLVRLDLAGSETVSLNFSRVIAMSTSLKARSRVALSAAAIAANRVFIKELYCPKADASGVVILETVGEPVAATGSEMTFDIPRMIAWDSSVQFSTKPLEEMSCIILEPTCVSVVSSVSQDCCVLLDADDGMTGRGWWGVARQVLALVIPGL